MQEQVVDMPVRSFVSAAVAAEAGLHVAPGAAGVYVIPGGEAALPQRSHRNGYGAGETDVELVGVMMVTG